MLLVPVLAAIGCGQPAKTEPDAGPRVRWIEAPALDFLPQDELRETELVEHWDLTREEEVETWRIPTQNLVLSQRVFAPASEASNAAQGKAAPHPGWQLEFAPGVLRLVRQTRIRASQVDLLELSLYGAGEEPPSLSWSTPGEGFSRGRSLQGELRPGTSQEEQIVRFRLRQAAAWSGTVSRLRLELKAVQPRTVHLLRLVALRETLGRERLAPLLEKPWLAELGPEVRRVLVAAPDVPLQRRFDLHENSLLRFAGGAETGFRRKVRFRVLGGTGERDLRTLQEGHMLPGQGPWKAFRVPLGELAGAKRLLRLEVEIEGDEPYDPSRGLLFWANPEVVRQAPEPAAAGAEDEEAVAGSPSKVADKQPPSLATGGDSLKGRPPLNLLLISIDTLRADRLSMYGHSRQTTPRLEQWAAERATVFRSVVAAAPWTLPSHVSMLSGLGALRHGVNHDLRQGGASGPGSIEDLDLLAEILHRQGYATGAATGGGYLHPRFGFAQGFDSYAYWPDRSRPEGELATGIGRALAWFADRRLEPSFFFLHSYAVHDPYRARQPFFTQLAPQLQEPKGEVVLEPQTLRAEDGFRRRDLPLLRKRDGTSEELDPRSPEGRELLGALYDSGVVAVDQLLGRLLQGLQELGLDRNTVVVITSDHGEALGEGGEVGHVSLRDHTLLVPLLISAPLPSGEGWLGAGTQVTEQVRGVDLLPTVLELLRLDRPSDLDGVSLAALMAGRDVAVPAEAWSYAASANRGLALRLANRWKLVGDNNAWARSTPSWELYDLDADPREERNLAASPAHQEPRDQLRKHWQSSAKGLHLHLANAGPEPLRVQLRGPVVEPTGGKSLDIDCDCVREMQPGYAGLELPAGAAFQLVLETRLGRHLSVELQQGNGPKLTRQLSLEELTGSVALSPGSSDWQAAADGQWPSTGVAIWWRGASSPRWQQAEPDPALRRQLRALGYL